MLASTLPAKVSAAFALQARQRGGAVASSAYRLLGCEALQPLSSGAQIITRLYQGVCIVQVFRKPPKKRPLLELSDLLRLSSSQK